MKRTQMVRLFYPGSLFAEEDTKAVGHKDPARAKLPKGAFAFQFFDRVEWDGQREDGKKITEVETQNESGKFYPGGEAFTAEKLRASGLRNIHILLSNMKCNGWKRVVRTQRGTFQPLQKGDTILQETPNDQ